MSASWHLFLTIDFFVVFLFIAGLYCILVTRNLIRMLIGLELLIKAVTLLIIAVGYVTGRMAMAQAIVITLIVVEVVVIVVAGGIIVNIFRNKNSLYTMNLRRLKW